MKRLMTHMRSTAFLLSILLVLLNVYLWFLFNDSRVDIQQPQSALLSAENDTSLLGGIEGESTAEDALDTMSAGKQGDRRASQSSTTSEFSNGFVPAKTASEKDVFKTVAYDVPFTAQAPLGDWDDIRQQNACEEASVLMAVRWARGGQIGSLKKTEQELQDISDFELNAYGHFHDSSAADTLERIVKGYFRFENASLVYGVDGTDIKRELQQGNIVIVPINGQELTNPYYTPPGPLEHMLVVIGYDADRKEFVTNDPGTKRGSGIRYDEKEFSAALQDYPSGYHVNITEKQTAMIVIKKEVNDAYENT